MVIGSFAVFVRRQAIVAVAISACAFLVVPFAATYSPVDPQKYFLFCTWLCVALIGGAIGVLDADFSRAWPRAMYAVGVSALFLVSAVAAASAHANLYNQRLTGTAS